MPSGNDFVGIAAGWGQSLALKSDGSMVGWGYVLISWSTNHSGYTLEARTELSSLPNWSNAPGTTTILGNQFVVTNSAASGNQFYRLKN